MNEFNCNPQIVNQRSELTHAILSAESRSKKAKKIFAILNHFTNFKSSQLLDIGTGSGHIAKAFCDYGSKVFSIDPYDLRVEKDGYEFKLVTSTKIPYQDAEFDIVISNHVIEHVDNQKEHLDEIYRVLKPGGFCYLATPSKFALVEPHYRLMFLSWFNKSLSTKLLKLIRNKVWDIKPLTANNIRCLANNRFKIESLSPCIMHQPHKYSLDMMPTFHFVFKLIPLGIWKLLSPFLPTIVLVLKKLG